ncbi:hypothetical protein LX32DRAFT_633597 [Colletotrichum zoysiae]|uniref:Uncharacterized protein n=1 Tax=Colletotrichum zoysiae TaxID=1216348 RepID=A0AAD9HU41_9PEZI|nr:hypothetical protein LX32DRAFT_633597 [Colletotrichum zoysiae]
MCGCKRSVLRVGELFGASQAKRTKRKYITPHIGSYTLRPALYPDSPPKQAQMGYAHLLAATLNLAEEAIKALGPR